MKTKNLRFVAILEQAKKNHLEQCPYAYICVCLRISEGYPEDIAELRLWVRGLLEGHATLELWLRAKGYAGTEVFEVVSQPKLKVTRLAWLDWMIGNQNEISEF